MYVFTYYADTQILHSNLCMHYSLLLEMILTKFNTHICCLYENSKHLVQNESWLTFPPTQFVNLLLIHHLKNSSTKEQHDLSANFMMCGSKPDQSYTTNKMDDIFKVNDCNVTEGKIIIIEGAPGMGKTILCKEIAYRWACKELFTR